MITDHFFMNGILWRVHFVERNDERLMDRTRQISVATTDPQEKMIYLSPDLRGEFLMTVFIHELGHCALYSFGILDEIRDLVPPENWIKIEELICNFLADYGAKIFKIAYPKYGYKAWELIPSEFEKYFRKEVS